jgi:predicted PurR-regulated permease PerM
MPYQHFDSLLAPIIATFFWSLCIGVASYLLVFKTKLFDNLIEHPLVPPFLCLPAIMFAFLMGFMSADAWQNYTQARTALINEASAISRLAFVPMKSQERQNSYNANLQAYLEAVLDEEWEKSFNKSSSSKAKEALNQLSITIWKGSIACANGSGKQGECIDGFTSASLIKAHDDLRNAREQRLSLGYLGSVYAKWIMAILLAFIAAVSVAAVQKGNQKTGVISLILFCSSIWILFSIVTMYSNPYKWAERLEPIPLSLILDDLKTIQK